MVMPGIGMNAAARDLLAAFSARKLKLAVAESCTGGLLSATLTEIPGSSEVVDRGFVTYSNESKRQMLGVPAHTLSRFGAVSRQTAQAMATGALARSNAHLTVAITGIAGPGGGSKTKPIGLVHIAAAARNGPRSHREYRFGKVSRQEIRQKSVLAAFAMLRDLAGKAKPKNSPRKPR
jgi:nicotinamide-nucleotide amidase